MPDIIAPPRPGRDSRRLMDSEPIDAELQAVFPFSGSGLVIEGAVLGLSSEFNRGGSRVTITLPGPEHVERGLTDTRESPDRWWKHARLTHGRVDSDELVAVTVERFEVRVNVVLGPEEPYAEVLPRAFPYAATAVERFLAWIRAYGGQFWLPSWHEGPSMAAYGELVIAGTYDEVTDIARWKAPCVAVGVSLEAAASPSDVDDARGPGTIRRYPTCFWPTPKWRSAPSASARCGNSNVATRRGRCSWPAIAAPRHRCNPGP